MEGDKWMQMTRMCGNLRTQIADLYRALEVLVTAEQEPVQSQVNLVVMYEKKDS